MKINVVGEPVSKQRPKVARGRAYTPDATRVAEETIRWELRAAGVRPKETGDLAVVLRFFAGDRRRRDLDNCVKLVLDACNGQVWKDDSQVVQLIASIQRGVGADHARTELEVYAA